MDIATVFEWFAEESKSIAEQETEPAQREKFAKLASLWANAMAESYFSDIVAPQRSPPVRWWIPAAHPGTSASSAIHPGGSLETKSW